MMTGVTIKRQTFNQSMLINYSLKQENLWFLVTKNDWNFIGVHSHCFVMHLKMMYFFQHVHCFCEPEEHGLSIKTNSACRTNRFYIWRMYIIYHIHPCLILIIISISYSERLKFTFRDFESNCAWSRVYIVGGLMKASQ